MCYCANHMERAIEISVLVILAIGILSGVGRSSTQYTNQADSTFYDVDQTYLASEDVTYDTSIYEGPYDVHTGARIYESDYQKYMGFEGNQVGYQYYLEDYNRYIAE